MSLSRPISIAPVLNGWIVSAGCQQLAYTSKSRMLADLSDYLDKPSETEERILEEAVNRQIAMPRNIRVGQTPNAKQQRDRQCVGVGQAGNQLVGGCDLASSKIKPASEQQPDRQY